MCKYLCILCNGNWSTITIYKYILCVWNGISAPLFVEESFVMSRWLKKLLLFVHSEVFVFASDIVEKCSFSRYTHTQIRSPTETIRPSENKNTSVFNQIKLAWTAYTEERTAAQCRRTVKPTSLKTQGCSKTIVMCTRFRTEYSIIGNHMWENWWLKKNWLLQERVERKTRTHNLIKRQRGKNKREAKKRKKKKRYDLERLREK